MNRTTVFAAASLATLSVAGLAAAQAYPQQQQYPQQQYPQQQQQYPQQQYPQQQYPQQQYPQQQYPQQQQYMSPQPMQYGAPPVAASAGAAFGSQGQVIVSADRLFGLSIWSAKAELDNNVTNTESGTAFNLLWGSDDSIRGPYSIPRLGVDFTVANGFSVGGSAAFVSRSGKAERAGGTVTQSADTPTITAFGLAPRFGYILSVNQTIGFWFKGGITYFSSKSESTQTNPGVASVTSTDTVSGFSLNLEPALVVLPVPHFGLTASLIGDIPLSGSLKQETTGATSSSVDNTFKITNFGLGLGILGHI